MSNDATFDEINALVFAYEEGSLTDADLQRLREILKADAGARRHFAAIQALETAIHLEHVAGGASRPRGVGPVKTPVRLNRRRIAMAAAAAMLIVGIGVLAYFSGSSKPASVAGNTLLQGGDPDNEPKDDGVAIFSRALDAEWSPDQSPAMGSSLAPGKYELRKGIAQLEFESSARVSVEGPARFEIVSSSSVTVFDGIVRTFCPEQAHGFVVSTPQMKVVDRGTDFFVQVSSGKAKVQVMEGEVDLFKLGGANSTSQRLIAGNAQAIDNSGHAVVVEAGPAPIDSFANLQQRIAAHSGQQFDAWRHHRPELISNPDLVAYYDFQHRLGADNILHDQLDRRSAMDGAIVGCSWTSGRWPGKDALEFKRPGDRVRVNIPGTFDALTLAAWIRVDGLVNRYHSLLLTDGYDVGRPHWQIPTDGTLRLGIRDDATGKIRAVGYASPPLFGPKEIGTWHFVCTVYDLQSGSVAHFLDGKVVSREALNVSQSLQIGWAEIGNWGDPLKREAHPIRNFNGRIDELFILRAALGSDEIKRLFDAGTP